MRSASPQVLIAEINYTVEAPTPSPSPKIRERGADANALFFPVFPLLFFLFAFCILICVLCVNLWIKSLLDRAVLEADDQP